jgi:chromosomal replication initiator protein
MANGVVTIPLPGLPLAGDASSKHGDSKHGRRRPTSLEFFVGPENCLIEPAVSGVLGRQPSPYNPLVLYGPSGTGKSHLARGLAATWKSNFPHNRVAYATAIDFAREMADAFETQAVEDFRARYRGVTLAVFEDAGELATKPAAQEELSRTLDEVMQRGGQVVLTASAAPQEIAGFLPALRSRLSAGLCVPLALPGPDARLAILQRWSDLREMEMADSILKLLAEGLAGTVPELLGAMLQLELPAREEGRPIDAHHIREFLSQRDSALRPKMQDIASRTARQFSLRLRDLCGPSRRRPVVAARDVAIYLCRQLTRESLGRIGEYFGGRDHTTVMHACRKAEELLQSDPAVAEAVGQLQRKFPGSRNTRPKRA